MSLGTLAIGNTGIGNILTLATFSNSPRKILAWTVKYETEAMYALSTEGEAEAWASTAHILGFSPINGGNCGIICARQHKTLHSLHCFGSGEM